jgi:hypothetical protein
MTSLLLRVVAVVELLMQMVLLAVVVAQVVFWLILDKH